MSTTDPAGTAMDTASSVEPGSAASAGPGPTAPRAGALPVAPVLVRDYRRLLRLFPYTYRRAHEAEMLGHLLDAAAPGQSRPSRADRWDLLRAAAREWLLAPLGSTARQRRSGSVMLLVALMTLLAAQATREVSHAVMLLRSTPLHDHLNIADSTLWIWIHALLSVPLAPAWVLWTIAACALVVGFSRAGVVLAYLAATAGVIAIAALVSAERAFVAYASASWVVALVAFALVVTDRSRLRGRVMTLRVATSTVWCTAVGIGALVLATSAEAAQFGMPWWSTAGTASWTVQFLLGPSVLVLGAMLVWARTRQAVPVLLGVATALLLGRARIFWSGNLQPDSVDGGNVLALLGLSVVATATARWVVNRLDELSEARASHRAVLAAAAGPAEPAPPPRGEPTAV